MKYQYKGNFDKAIEELKKDSNNAVAQVYETINNKEGKLSQVIFTLKNNYAKKESISDGSSNVLSNFVANYNATILNKLYQNGATLVATTNLDEFGLGGTGTFSNHGIIYNPLDKDYYVGGSSSGAAATFSSNIGFAIGSDTGDSVRLPASNIGKVGFKPSYGAVSRFGLFSYASSMDTVAWFNHSVNDCIIVAQTLFGQDKYDLTSCNVNIDNIEMKKPKRIAYLDCSNLLEDYVDKKYQWLLKKLSDQNIEVVKIKPNEELLSLIKIVYEIISFSEASSNLSNLTGIPFGSREEGKNWEEIMLNTRSENLGEMVKWRLILGSFYLENENQQKYFVKAQKVRRLISNWFNEIYDKYDFLIFPSSPRVAPKKDNSNKTKDYKYMDYILTSSNLVGNPSIGLKLGEYNNMPFNISIESKIYKDKELLSFALYMENILGENND